jgi:hypothetical protein
MSSRILYEDRVCGLTDESLVLRGFTKILGRTRRVELRNITSFTMRSAEEFPERRLPKWGIDDRGVWYTRDSRRWRRQHSIEITFDSGERVGFTPAHPARFRDLLRQLNLSEQ